jgi:hypothetical protein
VFIAYVVGGILMLIGGLMEIWLGVPAEMKSLERVATPLSAVRGGGRGRRGGSSPPVRDRVANRGSGQS